MGESEDSYFGDFIEDESADSPTDTATRQMLREPHQHPLLIGVGDPRMRHQSRQRHSA